jgi:tetratricopeptide (TPR) repeat protein
MRRPVVSIRTRRCRHAPRARAALGGAALIALLWLAGCGSNDGLPPVLTTAEQIALGWEAFADGDIAVAESRFAAAIESAPRNAEARVGLGGTLAVAGRLEEAAASLDAALDRDRESVDAIAGLAAVQLALGDLDDAIERGERALALDSTWAFAHRPGIDADDVRLVLAQAYALGGPPGYDEAAALLDRLDPSTALDPDDPDTWTVGTRRFSTYAEALLEALESVERRIGSALP